MKFNRKTFFDGYRKAFGPLSQKQMNGLEELLSFIEADPFIKDFRWAAYMLATVKVETAETYRPIHEYGGKSYFVKRYGGQTRKGKELGNDTPDEGYYYAGKGYPQTTGESNYERAEAAIRKQYPQIVADFERRTGKRFDLTVGDAPNDELDPQNMLDPAISYATMSYGMRTGMFTGKKLSDYIKGTTSDYKNARRIINGVDRNVEIAEYAKQFSAILRDSVSSSTDSAANASLTPSEKAIQQPEDQGVQKSATQPPIKPAEIHVENVENVKVDHTPPPSPEPVVVQIERVSVWAKIGAAFAGLSGIGISMGEVVTGKLNGLDPMHFLYVIGGVLLIALALYFYDKAQKRAHEKTLAKMRSAEDPAKNTVELTRAKQ